MENKKLIKKLQQVQKKIEEIGSIPDEYADGAKCSAHYIITSLLCELFEEEINGGNN